MATTINSHGEDSDEARDLMERCDKIQDVVHPLIGDIEDADTIGAWANALAIVAGELIGMIHQQLDCPVADDERCAAALGHNALNGIEMGREAARKGAAATH